MSTLPSLVIFDCDGVLVDSERLSHEVLREMLAEHGAQLTLQETFDRFMGSSTQGCLDAVQALIGHATPVDFLARFRDRSFEAFGRALQPVPGISPALTDLRALQVPYCVASNGPHEKMRFTLGHTGLLPYFESCLFSAHDVQRPKPAPDLFLHAAQRMGVAPNHCTVVEDSATGVAAARAAGMQVLGYAAMGQSGKLRAAGASAVFESMDELLTQLQGTIER
jgi:HAD superfamily hydrolase (TIGR01509 family)